MVAHYIATRSLMGLREGSERAPGDRVGMRWWEQAGLILHLPGTGDLGGRQRLVGGVKELVLVKGGLEEYDKNPQQGGSSAVGVRIIF